ncbi:MAG: radical SAM family heme chaperone HemW [Elusimicrobiales bacterium]
MRGLYIHIPFCSGKCGYCDFVSFAGKERLRGAYITALANEMSAYRGMGAHTLYIGGGTPSELDGAELRRLLNAVGERFNPVREFEESTVEVNPESITRDKIMILRQFGVSRISMGLQSFDDATLSALGRRHDAARFLDAYLDLRSVGFSNINIDVIAAPPYQDRAGFAETVRRVIELKPEHVSVYGLEIPQACALAGRGVSVDGDLCRDMLEDACSALAAAGYSHYEISNFARPGRECRHNINYWDNGEYIGIGCAAASYVGGIRRVTAPMLEHYCSTLSKEGGEPPLASCEKLEGKEKTGESLMLGLRKLTGLKLTDDMRRDFGGELVTLAARGLLVLEDDTARLTREGIYVSNEVFRSFVPPF